MLRIYLDQNKWIDLARAATGAKGGAPVVAVLQAARAAVEAGVASFPIDLYRYWETGKRADDRSRNDVVDVMLELSRLHTMALPQSLLNGELDRAVERRFGPGSQPRALQPFGVGVEHVLEQSAMSAQLPDEPRRFEAALLRLSHIAVERADRKGAASFGDTYVAHENRIAAAIRDQRLSGQMIDLAVRASDLGDIREPVIRALERVGASFDDLVGAGPGEVVKFVDELPTRFVTNVMRSAKLRQSEQAWEPNDLNDILALPVASVYCDVVVTERQWVHRLTQGKIPELYGTRLLSRLTDLERVLQPLLEG